MPGFTTHYIMGMKAYNDMPSSRLKHIISKNRWLYQLGLQGPDMFFYNLPVLRHRDYRNVGSYMHEHHVSGFFANYFRETSRIASRHQREQALAYFCGYLCHYVCDSICHPYIYGRIHYDTGKPTMRLHGLHAELENEIDALLLQRYKKKKPSQFNQAATICLNGQEMQLISRLMSRCINETYYPITYENSFQVTPRMIQRSIAAMRFGCRTLADPSGRKRDKVVRVESIFLHSHFLSSKLVTDQAIDARTCLNLDHKPWRNPWDPRMASTDSFLDLFHRSLGKCSTVFYLLNRAVSSEKPSEYDFSPVLRELGCYSYHSGLPTD